MLKIFHWGNVPVPNRIDYSFTAFALAMSTEEAIELVCDDALTCYNLSEEELNTVKKALKRNLAAEYSLDPKDGAIGLFYKVS